MDLSVDYLRKMQIASSDTMRLTIFTLFASITLVVSGCAPLFGVGEERWQKGKEINARKEAESGRMSAYDRITLKEREKMH